MMKLKPLALVIAQARPLLAASILVGSLTLLAACYVPPVWDAGDAINHVDEIAVGKTTRAEVLDILGDHGGNVDSPIYRYTGEHSYGFYLWFIGYGTVGTGDAGLIDEEHWWVTIVFDEKDVVRAACTSEDDSDKRQACDREATQRREQHQHEAKKRRERDLRELQEELSVVRVGATREQIEGVLGEPDRSESDEDGTVHVYRHRRGSAYVLMRVTYGPEGTVTRAETATQWREQQQREAKKRRERDLKELQEELSVAQVGATREQVEDVLGEPDASESGDGATIHVYRHRRGSAIVWMYVTYGPDGAVARAETATQRRERETADLLAKAQCGDARAQNDLGIRYSTGRGVPKDFARAYFWFSIAHAGGIGVAPRETGYLSGRITPEQIAEAERLMAEWEPKDCAAEEIASPSD